LERWAKNPHVSNAETVSANIMRTLLIVIFVTLIFDCYSQNMKLKIEFLPSFIDNSTLKIEKKQNHYFLELESDIISEKVEIFESQLVGINNFFDSYEFKTDSYLKASDKGSYSDLLTKGTDGVTVKGRLKRNLKFKCFEFWSPEEETENDSLIILLFNLMNENFKNIETIVYIEQLEQYFNFGLGLKRLSEDPPIYVLYGDISISEEEELIQFLNSLPVDSEAFIDMSNFNGMATILYPEFKKACENKRKIFWINCTEKAYEQLTEIGIDKKLISIKYSR